MEGWAAPIGAVDVKQAELPLRIRRHADGAEMVLVRASNIDVGAVPQDKDAYMDEKPQLRVGCALFYCDVTEVTNTQFEKFAIATGYKTMVEQCGYGSSLDEAGESVSIRGVSWRRPLRGGERGPNWGRDPVVLVSHEDAVIYAQWARAELPTEDQFEIAVRVDAGSSVYSWGDSGVPPQGSGNYAGEEAKVGAPGVLGYKDGFGRLAPVGSFQKSRLGLFDLSGNVGEWCSGWYMPDLNRSRVENVALKNPELRMGCAVRGGSWGSGLFGLRISYRGIGDSAEASDRIGFRLVKTLR